MKQLIIHDSKLVNTRTDHTCFKCNQPLAAGARVRSITGYTHDQYGKHFKTLYACKKHRIKLYCGERVIYHA